MGAESGYVVPVESGAGVGAPPTKKAHVGSRSWILMNASGQETMLDVDKYAIIYRMQIHARDLRIIDPLLSYPSTILRRERAIVLNLEHIKAIITAEEVLLREPLDENVVPIVEELRRKLKPTNTNSEYQVTGTDVHAQHELEMAEEDEFPFEFRALEVALEAICTYLAARAIDLETAVYPALDMLTSKISSYNLDRVRRLKSQMTRLTARVQKVRDELEQLLDDDDDIADLYLSRKLAAESFPSSVSPTIGSRISRGSQTCLAPSQEKDVDELEMLLEAYFMQIDGTLNKLTTLREYIDNTEDYINIQLDNHRNQLMQLELVLSSGTVCITSYSLLAGIFGMNIKYTWNDGYGYMFKWVVIFSGVFCAFVFLIVISYARYKGLIGSSTAA